MSAHDDVFAFIDRCDTHRSRDTLAADFSGLLEHFGFNHYIMTGLPSYGEDPEALVIVNRWPPAWLDRYRAQSYFFHDPVSLASFSQTRPFLWTEAREQLPATIRARQIEGEAREHGMVDGIGFPMADPRHLQAVVSLASDQRLDLSPAQQGAVYLASLYCQSHAQALIDAEAGDRILPHLTPREREVLTWMANGKSKWDTSAILNISESSVKKHVASAATKLNATNVTQAVARALHGRLIKL